MHKDRSTHYALRRREVVKKLLDKRDDLSRTFAGVGFSCGQEVAADIRVSGLRGGTGRRRRHGPLR